MSRASFRIAALAVGLSGGFAWAAGPVDGEVDAQWWAGDATIQEGPIRLAADDAGAPAYRGELWLFRRYGFRAGQYAADLGTLGTGDARATSLDFLWRAVSAAENTFFAVGLGWQRMELPSVGMQDPTSGARLDVEGRLGLGGVTYFYAQGGYAPTLDAPAAADPVLGRFEDLSGWEWEAGVRWKLAPFVHLRAGYRQLEVDYTRVDPLGARSEGTYETRGWLAGLGIHF